ncbi:hypothetical protein CYLTODRAFT_424434 [Cylindrobasidium torrendii FP15055 ss-10]|uniref:Family A G protein-coupled receptor-like protein n=1 Tax=Cylindrobasidium torrendii FP15055 ss-10 TaxID=1314674 RepID=A0A0D7B4C9_9AGAR|nr:hypothetical protein CYLTODRAFT_424434 [Cylindrobasidium torrendii FP15055 ss-10]
MSFFPANVTVDQNLAVLALQSQPTVTGLILQAVLWGCYALLVLPTIFAILRRRPRSRPWRILIGITVLMFLLSTICFVLGSVNAMNILHGVMLETQGISKTSPSAWYSGRNANNRGLAQQIVFSFEFMLGDGVVIWRAAGIWGNSLPLVATMLIPLLADFSLFLYFLGCEAETGWWYNPGLQARRCKKAQRAMFFLSFSTNFIATAFIIVKAWQHRDAFVDASPNTTLSEGSRKKYRSPAQRIMLLLIESGLVYMLFWASCSFTYFPVVEGIASLTTGAYYMKCVLNSIRYQVVGLYPTIMIYLFQSQTTSWETPIVTKSIVFKSPPRHFGHNFDSESQDDATEFSTDMRSVAAHEVTVPSRSFATAMLGSMVGENDKQEKRDERGHAYSGSVVSSLESRTDEGGQHDSD